MGVWIETDTQNRIAKVNLVTPCMGVWIETFNQRTLMDDEHSHTLYGCVDWNLLGNAKRKWGLGSHPVWVCGLKPK